MLDIPRTEVFRGGIRILLIDRLLVKLQNRSFVRFLQPAVGCVGRLSHDHKADHSRKVQDDLHLEALLSCGDDLLPQRTSQVG